MIEAYPLSWPGGWKRTVRREEARFSRQESRQSSYDPTKTYTSKRQLTINEATTRLQQSLGRMGAQGVIISSNLQLRNDGLPRSGQAAPSDPGAAVYWKRKGKQQAMAIDRYSRVADNLAAIAATLEALRMIERHGGGEILDRAFTGFAALPVSTKNWREILQIGTQNATIALIESNFRELVKTHHPDVGGTDEQVREIIQARQEAIQEING
jgi:hypothetical protein